MRGIFCVLSVGQQAFAMRCEAMQGRPCSAGRLSFSVDLFYGVGTGHVLICSTNIGFGVYLASGSCRVQFSCFVLPARNRSGHVAHVMEFMAGLMMCSVKGLAIHYRRDPLL
jgi:hypothetical protein